jgi:hypothetical protein
MKQQPIKNFTVQEAGVRGGLTTYSRYGRKHFQAIGKKGQASLTARTTSHDRHTWGSMGGRPRKRPYSEAGGERAL